MISTALKFFRITHNYTQEYVASKLNMAQSSYSDLESGKTKLSKQHAELLAVFYHVNMEVFLIEDKNREKQINIDNLSYKSYLDQYHEANKEIFDPILQKLDLLIEQTNIERKLLMEERKRVFNLLEKVIEMK